MIEDVGLGGDITSTQNQHTGRKDPEDSLDIDNVM